MVPAGWPRRCPPPPRGGTGRRRRHRPLGAVALVALSAMALGLSACAGPDETGTLVHRVQAWTSGTGFGQTVGTLYGDGQRVSAVVAERHGTGAIHTACGVLETDAGTADSNLPTPDEQLTAELSQAVELDYRAATDCYTAGATDGRLLAQSAALRSSADALLRRSVALVESITGHTVSTTTTTNPDAGSIFG